jgi:hypothetical protein
MNISGPLGISTAIIATFSVILSKLVRDKPFYEDHRWIICGALVGVGVILVVVGHFANRQLRPNRITEDGEVPSRPFMLLNMEFWGLMFAIFSVIIVFVAPLKKVEARATASVAAAKKVDNTNAPVEDVTNAVVTFPKLRLQGVVPGGARPSVLINGRTYFVGDLVEGAKVLSVDQDSAVVEFKGRQEALRLNH